MTTKWIVCRFALGALAVGVLSCGNDECSSGDPDASDASSDQGHAGNYDAWISDNRAGSGGSATGTGGALGGNGGAAGQQTGGSAGAQQGGSGGDVPQGGAGGGPPTCEGGGESRCFEGVFQTCNGSSWVPKRDCTADDLFCHATKGCLATCSDDTDCANYEQITGEYCRGDGRCSPKIFETVWKITSAGYKLTLPFYNDNGKSACDFRILWGDEEAGADITKATQVTNCNIVANRTHTYSKAGTYHVKILGIYDGWGEESDSGSPDDAKLKHLKKVVSFGPVGLTQLAFMRVGNIELPVKDIPDASKLTNAFGMFWLAESFNQPVGNWDVSNVTNMSTTFAGAAAFNQPLADWDVSHVTDMSFMFFDAQKFNQPVDNWNVSNVAKMGSMFGGATAFNQPLNGWKTSSVTNVAGMFSEATAFNKELDKWDMSRVTDMRYMFSDATGFNKPIGKWNVTSVTQMNYMFSGASSFDQNLFTWKLDPKVTLTDMFDYSGLTKPNYCPLVTADVWKDKIDTVGIYYDCP